ncbi:ubiquinone biosynthesis accessory factor UbiJ [Salinimonas chungwhensis]|uniref:ubiquinone biosynthesis accessory factor UbiJ n=1 Tax=Salinimonas chungwhensis TaxID=265425 RepID=UPI0003746B64|nr:SCP2 sterol-binding domain-containing protein [Salinimonas chungwhensis]
MPAASLFTATAETLLNRLIALDEDSAQRLVPLAGKRLSVFIEQLPVGITLVFSTRIDVLAEPHSFEDVCVHQDGESCFIKTSLDVLPSLTQTSQITRLIRADKLQLQGELSIAQQTAALFQQLDIDWEEQLARYTGDVPAHEAFASAQKFRQQFAAFGRRLQAGLGNALTEEKDIAVSKLAVMHFNDEVDALRDDVQRFEARLSLLEKNQ